MGSFIFCEGLYIGAAKPCPDLVSLRGSFPLRRRGIVTKRDEKERETELEIKGNVQINLQGEM
jgi:hypothetical protein